MVKLNVPTNIGFDAKRAMELANLVQRAYEQFNFFKQNPNQTWPPQTTQTSPRILTGSTTRDNNLDNPSVQGAVSYQLLSTFYFNDDDNNDSDSVPFGFIAQRQLENGLPGIFIVFRGTLTKDEWLDNLKFRQEPFFLRNPNLGRVSRGFQKIYTEGDDGETLANTVIKTLETVPINSQVFVTGHSLGAALATLCTLHISKQFVPSHPTFQEPILYTFASPRVGDSKFADSFKSLTAYRISNSEDFVVNVPPGTSQILGPEMFGQRIPKSDIDPNKTSTPSARNNATILNKFVNVFRKQETLIIDQVYEHVGNPLYFTDQRGYLSTNHNMFYIYREALPDPV